MAKWRPLDSDRGWPFVVFESEIMGRKYEADDFMGCPEEEEDGVCPVASDARVAMQVGAGEYAAVKRVPSAASRSMQGVSTTLCPAQLRLSARHWSGKMRMMFGFMLLALAR